MVVFNGYREEGMCICLNEERGQKTGETRRRKVRQWEKKKDNKKKTNNNNLRKLKKYWWIGFEM